MHATRWRGLVRVARPRAGQMAGVALDARRRYRRAARILA